MQRRTFIQKTALASSSAIVLPNIIFGKNQEEKKVRLGFIGVGLRGRNHVEQALFRSDVEINAICDINQTELDKTLSLIKSKNRKEPAVYKNGEHDFENMVKRDDLDGIVIATPWEWHVPMAIASMKAGKYTAVEVSATVTLQESWDLVNTFEKTGSHCMILENVCYRRDVMAVLNMVRQKMFGDLLHTQCGYQHDLREVKFNDGKRYYGGGVEFGEKAISEARWRTQHSVDRNGDLYPTHGLGPVAEMLNINRGNRFLYLTAMATKSMGLHNYIVKNGGEDHPNAKVKFKLGDVVMTNIKCANGETITITHDTNGPRPYSLGFRVQGTNGIWMNDGNHIYLEGISKKPIHGTISKNIKKNMTIHCGKHTLKVPKMQGMAALIFLLSERLLNPSNETLPHQLMSMMPQRGRPLVLCRKNPLPKALLPLKFLILLGENGRQTSLSLG